MQKIMFEHRRFGLEQAVIAGTKTMTRRRIHFPGINDAGVESAGVGIDKKGRVYFTFSVATEQGTEAIDVYPKYQIGERVAIAQSYASLLCRMGVMLRRTDSGSVPVKVQDNVDFTKGDFIIDGTRIPKEYEAIAIQAIHTKSKILDNKLFVRPDLMPHVIEIADIKAERLQDISEEDCLREGIKKMKEGMPYRFDENGKIHLSADLRMLFADLIDRISGRGTWQSNPWVYAYTFELIK